MVSASGGGVPVCPLPSLRKSTSSLGAGWYLLLGREWPRSMLAVGKGRIRDPLRLRYTWTLEDTTYVLVL